MAVPKPRPTEDDDVILYMDEIRSNGLPAAPLSSPEPGDTDLESRSIVPESATTLDAGARASRLLETDNTNNPRPEYGPEIDDLEPKVHARMPGRRQPYPGIDDGLLTDSEDEKPTAPGTSWLQPVPNFPNGGGGNGGNTPTPDMNVYQQKKTIAQGMMDLALISANANQFRYVLQSSGRHPYYYPSLAMIGLSLILQVIVGIGLIWNSRYNVKVDDQMYKANRANNWTVIAIFLVTILNVFISSFGVVESSEIIFNGNSAKQ